MLRDSSNVLLLFCKTTKKNHSYRYELDEFHNTINIARFASHCNISQFPMVGTAGRRRLNAVFGTNGKAFPGTDVPEKAGNKGFRGPAAFCGGASEAHSGFMKLSSAVRSVGSIPLYAASAPFTGMYFRRPGRCWVCSCHPHFPHREHPLQVNRMPHVRQRSPKYGLYIWSSGMGYPHGSVSLKSMGLPRKLSPDLQACRLCTLPSSR